MGTPKIQLWVQLWDNGRQAEPRVCAMMHRDPPQPPSRDGGEPWVSPWGGSITGLLPWPLTQAVTPGAGSFLGGSFFTPHLRALWALSQSKAQPQPSRTIWGRASCLPALCPGAGARLPSSAGCRQCRGAAPASSAPGRTRVSKEGCDVAEGAKGRGREVDRQMDAHLTDNSLRLEVYRRGVVPWVHGQQHCAPLRLLTSGSGGCWGGGVATWSTP